MGQGRDRAQSVKTEDGEMIEGVKECAWVASAQGPPVLVLKLYAEKVDFDLGGEQRPAPAPVPGE